MRTPRLRRILQEERTRLRDLFRRADDRPAGSAAERRALFYEIRVRIEDHLRGMQILVQHPDVQAAAAPGRIAELRAGHRLVDSLLSELSAQDPGAPESRAALRLLRRNEELLLDEVEEPLLADVERRLTDDASERLALKLQAPARAGAAERPPHLPPASVSARSHRRLRRVTLALALVVGAAGTAIVAALVGVNPFVRMQVEKLTAAALKTPVALERARVNIAGGIHLLRLSVGNPGEFKEIRAFRTARVDAAVALPSVLDDVIEVHDVLIVNPVLTLEFEDDRINWGVLMERLSAPAPKPVEKVKQKQKKFLVRRLRIVHPVVIIRSPKSAKGGAAITLRDIELKEVGTAPGSAAPFSLVLATVFQALLTGAVDQWSDIPGELRGSLERLNARTGESLGGRLKTPEE